MEGCGWRARLRLSINRWEDAMAEAGLGRGEKHSPSSRQSGHVPAHAADQTTAIIMWRRGCAIRPIWCSLSCAEAQNREAVIFGSQPYQRGGGCTRSKTADKPLHHQHVSQHETDSQCAHNCDLIA